MELASLVELKECRGNMSFRSPVFLQNAVITECNKSLIGYVNPFVLKNDVLFLILLIRSQSVILLSENIMNLNIQEIMS